MGQGGQDHDLQRQGCGWQKVANCLPCTCVTFGSAAGAILAAGSTRRSQSNSTGTCVSFFSCCWLMLKLVCCKLRGCVLRPLSPLTPTVPSQLCWSGLLPPHVLSHVSINTQVGGMWMPAVSLASL